VVVGLLVPFFTYMIPLYFQLRSIGMLDSLLGTNLVLASTQPAFGTFFMRAFFTDLPGELAQAGLMDGAWEWQIFLRIVRP
jgi:ABC-type glycerol-3-phosphate transport system permease component